MALHEVVEFVRRWSPHIWLFGSVFGLFMSGTLLRRTQIALVRLRASDKDLTLGVRYWWWKSVLLFTLHLGFGVVGVLAVANLRGDWASLLTLIVLLMTPLALVYLTYGALRFGAPNKKKP